MSSPPKLGTFKHRSHVPPELHSELSEYASLLRSMRVNHMSDLAGELIRCGKREKEEVDKEIEESETRARKRRRIQRQCEVKIVHVPTIQKKRKPDVYTLWPLFPEHCEDPEFSFEEEIVAIAEEWIRNCVRSQSQSENDEGEREDENVDELNEDAPDIRPKGSPTREFDSILPTIPLILSSVTFLRTLFHMLASHTTRLATAPQSRGRPMTWVDVIEVAACGGGSGLGLKDSEVFERIQARLCEIYGDHEQSIAPQISTAISNSKQALRRLDQKFQKMPFDKLIIPDEFREQYQAGKPATQESGSEEEQDNGGGSGSKGGEQDDMNEIHEDEGEDEEEKGENEDESEGKSEDEGEGEDEDDEEKRDKTQLAASRTIPTVKHTTRLSMERSKPEKLKSTPSTVSTSASQIDSSSNSDIVNDSGDEKDIETTHVKTKARKARHSPSRSKSSSSSTTSESISNDKVNPNSGSGPSDSTSDSDADSDSNSNSTNTDPIPKSKLKAKGKPTPTSVSNSPSVSSSKSQSKRNKRSERKKSEYSMSLPTSSVSRSPSRVSQSSRASSDEGAEGVAGTEVVSDEDGDGDEDEGEGEDGGGDEDDKEEEAEGEEASENEDEEGEGGEGEEEEEEESV